MKTFIAKDGFRFLDDRETGLSTRWFHYSPPETFSHMFTSPDWFQWRAGDFDAAVTTMLDFTRDRPRDGGRESDRTRIWARNGVSVTRLQAVDAASLKDPAGPLNYLLTYLTLTHPHEDRLIIDADACAVKGIALPDIDFLIHDDDLVMTKYETEPGVIHRDAYFNAAPQRPGDDDDRPVFRRYADLAERLLAQRDDLTYTGPLFGLSMLKERGII